jgi:hypothetical protein
MNKRTARWAIGLLSVLFGWSLSACSGGGGSGSTTFSLAVTGNPAGARIYFNGQLVEDPQRIVLPPGTHRIRVETTLSDGQLVAQEFSVVAGSVGSIQYDLSRYRIETNPSTIEVWVGGQIRVDAALRDLQTDSILRADFTFSIRDTGLATVQLLDSNTAHVTGIRRGVTRLVVTDTRTGVTFEVPISVLDFPAPPGD